MVFIVIVLSAAAHVANFGIGEHSPPPLDDACQKKF
jgi:hypothetical protein